MPAPSRRTRRRAAHPLGASTRDPPSPPGDQRSRGDQAWEERRAASPKRDAEPLRDRRAEVGKGRTRAKRGWTDARPEREQRNALARVVGRWSRRIVAVVGSHEQQVVLAQ